VRSVNEEGRILFLGHDREGVAIVRSLCARFRTSRRFAVYLESLTLNHLRLGFLVHERPLPRRRIWEYLRATEPESVDVTLLTVADRLATQGERTRPEAIDSHLALAREMIAQALEWRRDGPPKPPIRGDELAAELGIEPGPELGRLMTEIEAAQFAGEVTSRNDAVALARRLTTGVE
jgi:poly(A) polymerase